jgi:hypothetical protein
MSKGGSQQHQSQTVTQTNLPEYARPYFEGLMQRSSTLLNQPYQRYVNAEGQPIGRIAGFTPEQQAEQTTKYFMDTDVRIVEAYQIVDKELDRLNKEQRDSRRAETRELQAQVRDALARLPASWGGGR